MAVIPRPQAPESGHLERSKKHFDIEVKQNRSE